MVSVDIVSCTMVSLDIVSCTIVSVDIVSYTMVSLDIVSCTMVSLDIVSCTMVSLDIVSCTMVSLDIVSCTMVSLDITRFKHSSHTHWSTCIVMSSITLDGYVSTRIASEFIRQIVELQKTQSILKQRMSENEDKYHDTVIDLEARSKKNEYVVLKMEYQNLFDSIKRTRTQTQGEINELTENVNQKTYAYADVRAQNQDLLIEISELKAKLKNAEKVRKALFTSYRTEKSKFEDHTPVVSKTRFSVKTVQSKSLDTTPIVSKTKIVAVTPLSAKHKVVQIVLWIVDNGCSKHMTGDHSLLRPTHNRHTPLPPQIHHQVSTPIIPHHGSATPPQSSSPSTAAIIPSVHHHVTTLVSFISTTHHHNATSRRIISTNHHQPPPSSPHSRHLRPAATACTSTIMVRLIFISQG
nr:hypothetical protein [Tanacetum cinerariifolium]